MRRACLLRLTQAQQTSIGPSYCAAARIGMCAWRKRRTRSIVRCFSSSGSFHGNTVISALGASKAMPA